jgi:hypothetical protein
VSFRAHSAKHCRAARPLRRIGAQTTHDFSPESNSSASLSFCPILPLLSAGFNSPSFFPSPDSSADFFSRSLSSGLISCFLWWSCSSSLSPRLKGSLSSASGWGATEVNGCHFLPLLPALGEGWRSVGVGCRYKASTSSTGPVFCGAPAAGLKRLGLASGRVERRCGDAGIVSYGTSRGKEGKCSLSLSCSSSCVKSSPSTRGSAS